MGWLGSRINERFSYVRTSWPELKQIAEYENITGGKAAFTWLSPTKQSAEFSFFGKRPEKNEAVRIFYDFDDVNGEHTRHVIGTFLVDKVEATVKIVDGKEYEEGTVKCCSILQPLADAKPGYAYYVPASTNCVELAVRLAENVGNSAEHYDDCHLTVVADQSNYILSTGHSFEKDDSWLTIVNWLLSQAGFAGADVNTYGQVIMRKHVTEATPTVRFEVGKDSIIVPGIKPSNNLGDTKNACRVTFEDENICIRAWAINVSGSEASLTSRKWRESTQTEDVTELSSNDETSMSEQKIRAMREELERYAANWLVNNSSRIEYLEWQHAYKPMNGGDSVSVTYGTKYDLTLTNMDVDFSASAPCTSSGRRFVAENLVIETGSEVLWVA